MRLLWNFNLLSTIKKSKTLKEKDLNNNNIREISTDFIEDKYVLSVVPWYWPTLSGIEAERILQREADGMFLVRKSSNPDYKFTLTYKIAGRVGNLRVQCRDGLFSLSFNDSLQPREPTLQRLIEKLCELSKESFVCGCLKRELMNGVTTSVPLKLRFPLKRDVTLQEHCRKMIMRRLQPEDVPGLNLPEHMRRFLLELKDED